METYNTMVGSRYERLNFRRIRGKKMKLGKPDDDKIIVSIKTAQRDAKTHKMVYETVQTLTVYEADQDEVIEAITVGLEAAAKKK